MIRTSITFFILAMLSLVLGYNEVAGLSIEIGKMFMAVFLALSVISFLVSLLKGNSQLLL